MMVMTAKVDIKKVIIALIAVAGVIVALVLLLGGNSGETAPTMATAVTNNDARVQFLKDAGWEVNASPVESGQVRIPKESSEVYDRYNALQKSQGYDLSQYGGKAVMRYVYKVTNFPGATDPVYATLLVYKNQIIGGDITNTAVKGSIQGFRSAKPQVPESTVPSTTVPDSSAPTVPAETKA